MHVSRGGLGRPPISLPGGAELVGPTASQPTASSGEALPNPPGAIAPALQPSIGRSVGPTKSAIVTQGMT